MIDSKIFFEKIENKTYMRAISVAIDLDVIFTGVDITTLLSLSVNEYSEVLLKDWWTYSGT